MRVSKDQRKDLVLLGYIYSSVLLIDYFQKIGVAAENIKIVLVKKNHMYLEKLGWREGEILEKSYLTPWKRHGRWKLGLW